MSSFDNALISEHLSHVRIVMVNTTLPANIGSALRAMKTMGLCRLILVAPRTYPHQDCHLVFGTSARSRTIPWPLLDARPAAQTSMQAVVSKQQEIAIVFGREDRGLTNEELALANYHVTIPVNTDYGVLNVAQAIQVICYEMRMATLELVDTPPQETNQMPVTGKSMMDWDEPLVTHEQMEQFYPHLEKMLEEIEFLDPNNKRLLPLRLRRLFGRIQLDRMEYHLLRGIFSRVQALNNGTWKKSNSQKEQPDA
ncbi:MAG TPA: tRNA (cytosine(32)/uridine(32)-2'-O)-methyltransferase TrmJ [Acinetobacter radioresistens]|nr:tRNA (cytosine(32)/uridine(32)-2'-O)-methyltransferase TrmJ [Acinetobacter radioresistens]